MQGVMEEYESPSQDSDVLSNDDRLTDDDPSVITAMIVAAAFFD